MKKSLGSDLLTPSKQEREREKEQTMTEPSFPFQKKEKLEFAERRISAETDETSDIWRKVGEKEQK